MATHSRIGIYNQDGTITSIYCHFDGYLTHNGRILVDHYKDEGEIRQLMALGDLSCLGPEIGEQHPFDHPFQWGSPEYEQTRHGCLAYGRDRGETNVDARVSVNAMAFEKLSQEYNYIWLMGRWLVSYWGTDGSWKLVEEELALELAQQDD